ncbi:MAG TPA: thioredoxin family protein [Flavisolibacter sp.]|jgi:thiol-disulfide isomerase/thioredoxin|nr:thioredoxin family protein [Flavisolibacter sp.]
MKQFLLIAAVILSAQIVFAQTEISQDASGNKVLKGFITKQELATDSSFKWFAENQKGYTPDQNALQLLRANRDSINIVAFGGTWCGDTKFVLPKFFVLADAAGLSQDRVTLLGVDHSKKTIQHLSEAFGITNVPTIIVMKNGKELGRVVEYGHTGLFDKDLAEILAKK